MILAILLLLSTLHPSCWALTTNNEDEVGPITVYQPVVDDVAVIVFDIPACRSLVPAAPGRKRYP